MELNMEQQWNMLQDKLSKDFCVDADLNGTLFLIGLQERGKGFQSSYSKEEKVDMINLATCKLLMKWDYYSISGYDNDGWPIFEEKKNIPQFSSETQRKLLKTAILDYFYDNGYIEKVDL